MVSRREFFIGLAATAAAMTVSGSAISALIGDPRVKAWVLLDESEKLFKTSGGSLEYFDKMEELLDHLIAHFKPTVPPSYEDAVLECGDMFKRRGKYEGEHDQAHWRTCYDSTFAVMLVRDGLKNRKLPMIPAANWRPFAENFTKLVMAA